VLFGKIEHVGANADLGLQDHLLTKDWGHADGFSKQCFAGAVAIDVSMVKEIGAELKRSFDELLSLSLV